MPDWQLNKTRDCLCAPLHKSVGIEASAPWCMYNSCAVYPCVPLCIHVYPCVPLCTPVYPCVSLCTPVYPCVPLCTPVYPCVPLCTVITQS